MAILSRLPGLGPRSARRATLALLTRREQLMGPLLNALHAAHDRVVVCDLCGALSTQNPCPICSDKTRDGRMICVVEDDASLWAMERVKAFEGHYHVMGGLMSALEGVRPEDLRLDRLLTRLLNAKEVIMALPATVEGQTTAFYLADRIAEINPDCVVSHLARGVPVGGALDWLDEGTIVHALKSRA